MSKIWDNHPSDTNKLPSLQQRKERLYHILVTSGQKNRHIFNRNTVLKNMNNHIKGSSLIIRWLTLFVASSKAAYDYYLKPSNEPKEILHRRRKSIRKKTPNNKNSGNFFSGQNYYTTINLISRFLWVILIFLLCVELKPNSSFRMRLGTRLASSNNRYTNNVSTFRCSFSFIFGGRHQEFLHSKYS